MKKTVIFLLPLLATLLAILTCQAQDTLRERKNSFYVSLSGEGSAVAFNYEREFWHREKSSLRARLGFGWYVSSVSWDLFGDGAMHFGFSPDIPVGVGFLYGKRNKFDGAAGVIFAFGPDVFSDEEASPNAWPFLAAGYRYVSRSQKFMFRMAVSVSMHEIVSGNGRQMVFPLGLTIGLGGNF